MTTTTGLLNAVGLAPILTVNDFDQSLSFYQKLGFGIEEPYERDGKRTGARLAAGEARLNLTQDDWTKGRDRVKGVGVRIFIVTAQDVDALAAKVREGGVSLDSDPEDMPWGRSFGCTDPDGFKVTIARLR